MNIKSLLIGMSLSLIPTLTNAQCVATTDCATLGYTETSCPDGKGIKCPFGNTFACPISETKFCDKYEFKYDCKGSNYVSGMGQSCNGKYALCSCVDGYEWKNGQCQEIKTTIGQCTGKAKNCKIGQILNSDGTCTTDKEASKTPLGVVIYIGGNNCGYAMTANPIINNIRWSDYYQYVNLNTSRSDDWREIIKDYDACNNTRKLIQAGDASKYPAAWAAYEYAPPTAPETKGKWCLPAAGMLSSLFLNLNVINNAISKLGGTKLTNDNEHIWSSASNEYGDNGWVFCRDRNVSGAGVYIYGKNTDYHAGLSETVRPVLVF